MEITKILENNKKWVSEQLAKNPHYFENLSKGQNPKILYIGCSDSRVTAEQLMGAGPGDVFVHRNIANMVVNTDLNVLSAIDYAILHLNVSDVVICGHYHCGGVKAAMQSSDLSGSLNPWLRNIRDVYRLHQNELDQIENEEERFKRFTEKNVIEQCINVFKIPTFQAARKEKHVCLHGWIFDVKTGHLIDLNFDIHQVSKDLMSIYRIED